MYNEFIILFIIIFIMFYNILYQKKEINTKKETIKKLLAELEYYKKECKSLKDIVGINNEIGYIKIDSFIDESKVEPIYKGKKALIGDYLEMSYINTKTVLENLGFEVEVALSCAEVIKRISDGEKYDIIFSNNVYRDNRGSKCLAELKRIEGFNIPVVLHTISKNKRDYFINEIGFDEYIEKPITQEKIKPILEKILLDGSK